MKLRKGWKLHFTDGETLTISDGTYQFIISSTAWGLNGLQGVDFIERAFILK